MKSLFDPREAEEVRAAYPHTPPELAARVYTSRLIGRDPSLVLHGGGNTSVKVRLKNLVGEERDVLFVKGSGGDLGAIGPEGFTGLELEPLRKLKALEKIADREMENELAVRKIVSAAPDPSVEALLHAFLPHRYIDHTHADVFLVLSHLQDGEALLEEALGAKAVVLPYLTPGLLLAKGVLQRYEEDPQAEAIAVAHHGIFTFGEDARASYERMIACVSRAEDFLAARAAGKSFGHPRGDLSAPLNLPSAVARFNQAVRGACAFQNSQGRLRRFYTETRLGSELAAAALLREARDLCASGVLTPDHVTRTKNQWAYLEGIPEDDAALRDSVQREVNRYQKSYDAYFASGVIAKVGEYQKLDSSPRLFLVGGAGIVALGFTRREARVAADIAERTLRAKLVAGALGEYVPLSEAHVFAMEYWPLQQKKMGKDPLPLQGQVALVTGGAGAIGLGIADRLLASGAAVVLSDIDERGLYKVHSLLARRYEADRVEKMVFDVTDFAAVAKAFEEISIRLGGIDILVPNAGIAHVARLEDLDPEKFERVIAVNLKGTFHVIKASAPIFRRQGTGGNIVVISSKNVFDPGAAFGAYSASKAGAHQIARIAALELAELGVRVNMVNPDAVFGDPQVPSKLWELVGPERMKSRGLDPQGLREYYRQRNLLKVSVTAEDVGNAVVFFASQGAATTGATLPVDGGIPAAFPR